VASGAEPKLRDPVERALEGLGRAGTAPTDRGGTVPAGEERRWDSAAEDGPFIARVDGDGVDDIIGRYRLGGGPSETLWVGAFDGRTRARLWKIGLLKTNGALRAVRLAVAGDRLLVTDGVGMDRVHAVATGALVGETRLPAPARRVCSAPSGASFYVIPAGAVDGIVIDGSGRIVAGGRRPAWCPIIDPLAIDSECWRHAFHAHAHAPCVSSARDPAYPRRPRRFRDRQKWRGGGRRVRGRRRASGGAAPRRRRSRGEARSLDASLRRRAPRRGSARSRRGQGVRVSAACGGRRRVRRARRKAR
jgi:hypothetical protein